VVAAGVEAAVVAGVYKNLLAVVVADVVSLVVFLASVVHFSTQSFKGSVLEVLA